MIEKIISGGQTGADRGGLLAGKALGIETGGTAPPHYQTETGSDLSLKHFNLIEGEYDPRIYPRRTRKNVMDSDGTLLVGHITSPGTRLTSRLCKELSKPCITNPTPSQLKAWIESHNIEILNVAGNRESRHPGITKETFQLLYSTLEAG